jgi:hypothetical protein
MKDLSYKDNVRHYAGSNHLKTATFKISSEDEITYSIYTPYRINMKHKRVYDDDVRLWILYHNHGDLMFHVNDGMCQRCKREFPPIESLATAIDLQEFKSPTNDLYLGDMISRSIGRAVQRAASNFEEYFLR